jgi:hypothetical protein
MIETSCHCGAVRLRAPHRPQTLTSCNCSLCRRVGALWGYYEPGSEVTIEAAADATVAYVQGDRTLEMHHCAVCGCVTHWQSVPAKHDRMGVNFRLADPADIADVPVRRLDGADTWKYLD